MTSELDLISFDPEAPKPGGDANNNPQDEIDKKDELTNNITNGDTEVHPVNGNHDSLLIDIVDVIPKKNSLKETQQESDIVKDCAPQRVVTFTEPEIREEEEENSPEITSVYQENGTSTTVEIVTETEVLQTDNIKEAVEITLKSNPDVISGSRVILKHPVIMNGNGVHEESIIEREIRLQKEREETLARERMTLVEKAQKEEVTVEVEPVEAQVLVPEPEPEVPEPLAKNQQRGTYKSTLILPERSLSNGTKLLANSAETKIAMEIREMREREEELRKMREKLQLVTNGVMPQQNGHGHSDESVKSEDYQDTVGSESPSDPLPNIRDHKEIARAVSLDSIHMGQTYNIGYVFAHRKREHIKVKPLADGDGEDEKPMFKTLNESPIEREIRILREREEELKRDKQNIISGNQKVEKINGHENSVKENNLTSSNPNSPKPVIDTQRQLATTRIQQEIEEQTRREIALRASGNIKTISQERTDAKVTRLAEEDSSPEINQRSRSLPENKISHGESNNLTSNGHGISLTTKTNGKVKSPSSGTSSSSSTSRPVLSVGRRFSNPPPGKNVSMQRFINSKGKDIAFSNGTCLDRTVGLMDYYEIKPPQVRKGDGQPQRRSITAESKIQDELKEMKNREDELKNQRSRLLGLSQPNLTALSKDEESGALTNGSCQKEDASMERCSSNPNLLEKEDSTDGLNEEDYIGGPRRRSSLIDQWEQRIQKSEIKS